jgi:RNA ligase
MFPTIFNIKDILPAIEGRDAFIQIDRGDHTIVDYVLDDFPGMDDPNLPLLKECRGIIFDKSGNIIRRPLHKFFNLGQKDEAMINQIDISKPHTVLTKLDGSMLAPYIVDGRLCWGTRKGETEVAEMIKPFLDAHPTYVEFARNCCEDDWTPVFEFCSRKNQIVIDYGPEDRLVLIALRNMITGRYFTYSELVNIARLWNLEVVGALNNPVTDMAEFSEIVKNAVDMDEGFVVAFDDGFRTKIKTANYVAMHKVKDSISDERAVVSLILNSGLDDCFSFLNDADTKRVRDFEDDVIARMCEAHARLWNIYNLMKGAQKDDLDRKTFALSWVPNYRDYERVILFHCWDKEVGKLELYGMIQEQVKKSLTSTAKFASMKNMMNIGDY